MHQEELIPHLFRTEFSKITAVLCKYFGIEHIAAAEDIACDTFAAAFETWTYKGVPENPVAWLYSVAKNKAKNQITRNKIFKEKITPLFQKDTLQQAEPEIDLSEKNITDSQLQMLFTICHPSIPAEAQIGLALRILCGFGIDEIANAFLTSKETINKRLYRAREKLRSEKIKIEFPNDTAINNRLEAVAATLYLLFNEGYYSESNDEILRNDFCLEAMRLTYLLIENNITNLPFINALLALMCFHASRFEARKNEKGEIILYNDQDESLWNQELITKGIYFLKESAQGNSLTKYHLEANIAYHLTNKADSKDKWEQVLQLYNHLLVIEYSPVAALNRTFAFSKVYGIEAGIKEAEKLDLTTNPFYFSLLGELYTDIDSLKAKQYFQNALVLARTHTDSHIIQQKINKL
jgi:RNA polymerase sigma factor (sigma-70 family)